MKCAVPLRNLESTSLLWYLTVKYSNKNRVKIVIAVVKCLLESRMASMEHANVNKWQKLQLSQQTLNKKTHSIEFIFWNGLAFVEK